LLSGNPLDLTIAQAVPHAGHPAVQPDTGGSTVEILPLALEVH
jgi:hypothetical protein